MQNNYRIFWACLFVGVLMFVYGLFFGQKIGEYNAQKKILQTLTEYNEPTPQECLSVCVEEFERYGC